MELTVVCVFFVLFQYCQTEMTLTIL